MSDGITIGPRQPRERDPKFLAFVRTKPCLACGRPGPSDAAHVRLASRKLGKRYTGKGEKPSDRWAVPLCRRCHKAQHNTSEQMFWFRLGKNPLAIAAELYRICGSAPTTKKPRPRTTIRNRGFPPAKPQRSATRPVERRP